MTVVPVRVHLKNLYTRNDESSNSFDRGEKEALENLARQSYYYFISVSAGSIMFTDKKPVSHFFVDKNQELYRY